MKGNQGISEKLISLLRSCNSIKELKRIHSRMLTNATHHKPSFLLSKAIAFKDLEYSSSLFHHIAEPDEFTFNIMIRGLTTTWKTFGLALALYYRMKLVGLKPDKFTFPFFFIACSNLSELSHARGAHSSVFKLGLDKDEHVSHSLITMYAKCGDLGCARKVFDEISERDLVSWNSMISGYAKMGFSREALRLFREMREAGFDPDETTLVSVLGACGDLGDLRMGIWVEEFVVERKLEINSFIGSSLIGMYGKCGELVSARRVFDSIAKKERVAWNALISGYAQNGFSEEAISVFKEMKERGIDPDNITLVVTLSACGSSGALETGKWVEKFAAERGSKRDVYVATALLDMYAKCGSVDEALRVFNEMPTKNEASFNATISALATHGRAREAVSLFRRMSKPDEITFVVVLSACVHAGLVDEGLEIFESMGPKFGVGPGIEHFSCAVDLLARSGRVRQAWSLVEKMPVKPDAILLGALLAACERCRDREVAERVAGLLLDLEPSNAGNYIISSKVYAKMENWEESARMRVLMRERGVSKTPGWSLIEIGDRNYEFRAGDLLHDGSTEMSRLFGLLIEDLKKEGYVPNLNVV